MNQITEIKLNKMLAELNRYFDDKSYHHCLSGKYHCITSRHHVEPGSPHPTFHNMVSCHSPTPQLLMQRIAKKIKAAEDEQDN